jgi:Tfp pilus assembly protein PilN
MSVRINLLPEARMIKLKNQQTKRLVTVVCLVLCSSVAIILVVLMLLLGARNIQFATNKNTIDGLNQKIAAKQDVEQDAAWFNGALAEADKLSNNRVLISQLFARLADASPEDIKITNLTVDPDYRVKASVEAKDFNNVALFINALKSYNVDFNPIPGFDRIPVFKDVDVQAVTKRKQTDDANFEVTFTVDEQLVKKFREDSKASNESTQNEGTN